MVRSRYADPYARMPQAFEQWTGHLEENCPAATQPCCRNDLTVDN